MITVLFDVAYTLLAIWIWNASRHYTMSWLYGILGFGICGVLLYHIHFYPSMLVCIALSVMCVKGWCNWYYQPLKTIHEVGYDPLPIINVTRPVHTRNWLSACCVALFYSWYAFYLTGISASFLTFILITLAVSSVLLLCNRYIETWQLQLPLYVLLAGWAFESNAYYAVLLCTVLFINAYLAGYTWTASVHERDITWKLM